jgi:hypothetical protein
VGTIMGVKEIMFKEVDYNKHFVIGTPLVGWKVDRKEHMAWLHHKDEILAKFPNAKFFASFELDHRGTEVFQEVIDSLKTVNGDYWTYTINDMEEDVTYRNRWIRIETGRNLIREFSQRYRVMSGHHWGEDCTEKNYGLVSYEAILYVDSDTYVDTNIIEKMFEIDHPIVSVNVPAYGLSGKLINEDPRIEEHWNTAGMLLVNSPTFYDVPWSHNAMQNLSDDPTFQYHAERLGHGQTWVRKDVSANHMGQLVAVENRKIPKRII